MKKKIIWGIVLGVLLLTCVLLICFLCNTKQQTKAVWWWNDELSRETYLPFLEKNDVNEIYLCDSDFNENTNLFIKDANSKGIKVFYLAGEYKWIENPENLYKNIEKYKEFQSKYKNNFSGIHLDIEPHQHPEFSAKRKDLLLGLITLADNLKSTYKNITFDFDIPFWFDDEISFKNETKQAYKFMIDIADRIFVMSYRDTAQKIYSVAEDEINYATQTHKTLILSIETKENEDDFVTFFEEGKEKLNQEIKTLKEMLPTNFGISIHHVKSWYDLID